MRLLITFLACVVASCASTPPPLPTPPAPVPIFKKNDPGLPAPVFENQNGWVPVPTEATDDETMAVASLERPELAGRMRLELVRSHGLSPHDYLDRFRVDLERLPDMDVNDDTGTLGDEAALTWVTGPADPVEGRTFGHVLIMRVPGTNAVLGYCEGWWPESSDPFLTAQIYAACRSLRSPP